MLHGVGLSWWQIGGLLGVVSTLIGLGLLTAIDYYVEKADRQE